MEKAMYNINRGFGRNISKSFSGNQFLSEECENFNEVSVSGFASTVTEEYLQRWFTKMCGNVKCVKMGKSEYGKPLGFCTVCFYSPLDAERAVQEANNRELNGRILSVKPHKGTEEQSEAPGKSIFVKGFGETLDDKKLEMYFKDRIGNVEMAVVAKFEDGVSKGYGKVRFYNHQDARKAVMELNGVTVHGNILCVEPFKEQRHQENNRNVYVKGFGDILCDDDDLRVLFERFGKIDSAKIERDDNGKSKEFGYVCFQRYQDAITAITEINGKKLGSKILSVSAHQSKEERQKEMKNKNLHVRDLHKSVNENELRELFTPYGKISSVAVKDSPLPGINQGYVCFETSKEADNAVAELHLYPYKGLKLKVAPVQTKNKANLTKLNAYKYRSKSLGKLTKNDTMLQVRQGGKSLELTRVDVSSLMQKYEKKCFNKKVSENSDQTHETPKFVGNEVFSLKQTGQTIPEKYEKQVFCKTISENSDQTHEIPKLVGNEVFSVKQTGQKIPGKYEKKVFSKTFLENSDQTRETPKFVGNEVSSPKETGQKIPGKYEKNVFSKKVSENSDQTHETPKLVGNEMSSLKETGQKISENFYQVCRNPEPLGNEKISLPESAVPSQIHVLLSENRGKNRESLANETRPLQRPMAVPDPLEEKRKKISNWYVKIRTEC